MNINFASIPREHRRAAIEATARRFSRQALVIDALGLAIFIVGVVAVWWATP